MNIFVSGIGGAGLGPLAEIALDAGFRVFGSDAKKSLQTAELENRGVKIFYNQNAENLAEIHEKFPLDWLVFSSAVPENSPEIIFAKNHQIRATKRDEFLAEFIAQKKLNLIAVAGTHGKTTTTAMLIWVFNRLKIPVSYSVGTILSFANSGKFAQNSKFFIYEADEYDRNFLHFFPKISAIPALDFDHADIYNSQKNYNDAFLKFISQSDFSILWRQNFAELFPNFPNFVDKKIAKKVEILSDFDENFLRDFSLAGKFMRQNALLAREILKKIFADFSTNFREDFDKNSNENSANFIEKKMQKITQILNDFPGTSRRFETLLTDENSGGILISDYAHAPAEISATLEKAREIIDEKNEKSRENLAEKNVGNFDKKSPKNLKKSREKSAKNLRKIIAIYEPHQNLRQVEIAKNGGYKKSFGNADEILWLPTFLVRGDLLENSPEILTPENLIKTLAFPAQKIAKPANLDENLAAKIRENLRAGNLILAMGAGPIDAWLRKNFLEKN